MKEKDLIDLTGSLVGDLRDYKINVESWNDEGWISKIIRDGSILTTGRFKGVKYPTAERAGILVKLIAAFIVFASAGALLCNALNINTGPIWQLRVMIRSAITAMIEFTRNACMFLLNNKLVALLFGLVLLVWLIKKKQ